MNKKFPYIRTGSDFLKKGTNDISIIDRIWNT